jgi:hypothetical protein
MNDISFCGIYVETPYENKSDNINYSYIDRDAVIDEQEMSNLLFGFTLDGNEIKYNWVQRTIYDFFPTKYVPIKWLNKTKLFTADDELLIKRIRDTVFNIYSKGPITLVFRTFKEVAQNWIQDTGSEQIFAFNPTEDLDDNNGSNPPYNNEYYETPYSGTQHNILTCVPTTENGDDDIGKPVKYSIEMYGELYTQINSLLINLRPIHNYLR